MGEGGEHAVKIAGPLLLWFGIKGVLKILWEKGHRRRHRLNQRYNVFVGQSRLHRVCQLYTLMLHVIMYTI